MWEVSFKPCLGSYCCVLEQEKRPVHSGAQVGTAKSYPSGIPVICCTSSVTVKSKHYLGSLCYVQRETRPLLGYILTGKSNAGGIPEMD